MKVEYLNPFLKSAMDTFRTMVNIIVKPGKPYLLKDHASADISGIINISGSMNGVLAIAYPLPTALKISSKFLGEEITDLNANVADCIGELANIISGSAKQNLPTLRLSMSLPKILRGQSPTVEMPRDIPVICIPFESEAGDFVMEVCQIN
jgi:chemotaxis protein CheX